MVRLSDKNFLKYVLCFIFVINVLDATLTLHWIFEGLATEANPLMAALISYSPILFWCVKVLVVYVAALGLWVNRHIWWVRKAALVTALIYGWVFLIHINALCTWKI